MAFSREQAQQKDVAQVSVTESRLPKHIKPYFSTWKEQKNLKRLQSWSARSKDNCTTVSLLNQTRLFVFKMTSEHCKNRLTLQHTAVTNGGRCHAWHNSDKLLLRSLLCIQCLFKPRDNLQQQAKNVITLSCVMLSYKIQCQGHWAATGLLCCVVTLNNIWVNILHCVC